MSGRTVIPSSRRIASASGVVGPLAPSTTTCARTCGAIAASIVLSIAAGINTSHSQVSSSSLVIASAPGKSVSVPFSR